jgi:hypothetical protein
MKRAKKSPLRFAVCIKNKGHEASLEIGKLYRIIPDAIAQGHGYLRVVDESGEDYGYAADRFFAIDVPKSLERALAQGDETLDDLERRRRPTTGPERLPRKGPERNKVSRFWLVVAIMTAHEAGRSAAAEVRVGLADGG